VAAGTIAPVVSWGTSPDQAAPVTGTVPDPASLGDDMASQSAQAALRYWAHAPDEPCHGRNGCPWVGSPMCENWRDPDAGPENGTGTICPKGRPRLTLFRLGIGRCAPGPTAAIFRGMGMVQIVDPELLIRGVMPAARAC